jgi:hypothetical protein
MMADDDTATLWKLVGIPDYARVETAPSPPRSR